MRIIEHITAARVRELLDYNPDTGVFRWRVDRVRANAGDVVGFVNQQRRGQVQIYLDGRRYLAHRLAWLWMASTLPSDEIDHKDGDPTNNRWVNLRLATSSQNRWNTGKLRRSTTGLKGVSRTKVGKWRAQMKIAGKNTNLGTFDTAEEAARVYNAAALRHHGEFAQLNRLRRCI